MPVHPMIKQETRTVISTIECTFNKEIAHMGNDLKMWNVAEEHSMSWWYVGVSICLAFLFLL